MKDNLYRNAVDHLRFSESLEQAVLKKAESQEPRFRILRMTAIAATVCLLFATTVFAAEQILAKTLRVKETGQFRQDFSNTTLMEFTCSDTMSGVEVYHMELKPKGYYHVGEGQIYNPTVGFLKVTQGYELEALESQSIQSVFEKNGRIYTLGMDYVESDGGIFSDLLHFYPVKDNEILVNMRAEGTHAWPVYVNIKTGASRDALPAFEESAFLPEKLESGYEARLTYTQPFRDGILISTLVTGLRNGNTDSRSLHYWVKNGSQEAVKLELPKNSCEYVIDDTLYYQDSAGYCYVMDDDFTFHKIEGITETTDNLNCGLLTFCSLENALEIIDVVNSKLYIVPEISVEEYSLWDTTGYNATRHSLNGKIVVSHSINDYEEGNRPLDTLAYLDLTEGELRQLHIDADCHVQTHGWLDDDRYCVIYEDGVRRYMSIYEFK